MLIVGETTSELEMHDLDHIVICRCRNTDRTNIIEINNHPFNVVYV
jgi:hypothetical protein